MTRSFDSARKIAGDIVRLAESVDPAEYQGRYDKEDLVETITQDLLSDDTGRVFGWLAELILADTTAEEDAAGAQDLQYELLQWIAAE